MFLFFSYMYDIQVPVIREISEFSYGNAEEFAKRFDLTLHEIVLSDKEISQMRQRLIPYDCEMAFRDLLKKPNFIRKLAAHTIISYELATTGNFQIIINDSTSTNPGCPNPGDVSKSKCMSTIFYKFDRTNPPEVYKSEVKACEEMIDGYSKPWWHRILPFLKYLNPFS